MTFPGLTDGETLERVYKVPKSRGAILSEDSEPLAIGPRDARRYPAGTPFALITGFVRTPESAADLAQRRTLGWSDEEYGQAGLERSLDPTLVGTARRAAGRPLGRRPGPQAGGPCRQAPAQREDDAVGARPGGGGDGAGRSQRRHRRARRAERRAARRGRERADRPAAARLDVQDGDGIGGAGVEQGDAVQRVPVREVPRDQRVQAQELPQGVVRRHAGERLRGELQLGVRPAGGRGRRQADERDGRPLRVQPAPSIHYAVPTSVYPRPSR